ncbi:hypothetical protein HK103_003119 [Boothiomyces macroporosus]|uniref:Peroxidase n=1 Tax=Boothiomyces macroporosus TaxID=261099 RepID=A0AAD5UIV1_9FUNG|nr:hypothetical protein HK103_003119 [Boothiomyces macroporosus]
MKLILLLGAATADYVRMPVDRRALSPTSNTFTRLFPKLERFAASIDDNTLRSKVIAIGVAGGIMDAGDFGVHPNINNLENPTMSVGYTTFGQFLDHDITFDARSVINANADPLNTLNFRTTAFDLDSVYGSGPVNSPQFYTNSSKYIKFIVPQMKGSAAVSRKGFQRYDVPRTSNLRAIIADPRNDEHITLNQLQLAFLKFHNAVTDIIVADPAYKSILSDPYKVFYYAKQTVIWHYQYIIVHEFLPKTVGQSVVDDILKNGLKYYDPRTNPAFKKNIGNGRYMASLPIEFSSAAYRFGHSQVRPSYTINFGTTSELNMILFDDTIPLSTIDPNDMRGGTIGARRFIDWQTFFTFPPNLQSGVVPTHNMAIDTKISSPLFHLPKSVPAAGNCNGPQIPPGLPCDGVQSLASRNLARQVNYDIPSGQDIAAAMGLTGITVTPLQKYGLDKSSPLWFYCLYEAQTLKSGQQLGPVCGRIVAEVFFGLLYFDQSSYLVKNPSFVPNLKSITPGTFTIPDLLILANVVTPLS